ncbi:hypothetical protein BpHYR1_010158 [Brachionus plicatilis]|uniref:Uncharacterized protein n=1 Tax=Brachionus plicatilis TaxID=10195 RepID=A0A3M7PX53_BRAPC|nr:hypothetical protein BpHYR1_010158 [Brachionus plicatilis]
MIYGSCFLCDQWLYVDLVTRLNGKIFAHLKVKNSSLKAVTGDHFCQSLDDADGKCLIAEQELKKMVTSNVSEPIRECYNEIQSKLLESGISPDILAAKFPSFAKLTSTLQKRRKRKQPEVPKDFQKI